MTPPRKNKRSTSKHRYVAGGVKALIYSDGRADISYLFCLGNREDKTHEREAMHFREFHRNPFVFPRGREASGSSSLPKLTEQGPPQHDFMGADGSLNFSDRNNPLSGVTVRSGAPRLTTDQL